MIKLARLFSKGKSAKVLPKVPEGERYYVIGDIHGRCDLFDELIVVIEDDDRRAGPAQTTVVLLGDLVDRGPESARVIHGGRETVLSYGIKKKRYNELSLKELQAELHKLVPAEHRNFLAAMEDIMIAGDYVFVHAGIDPKRSIEDQKSSDMRWIRDRFLKHREPLSHVVVHGHTIFEDVEHTDYRIGIDTGAFRTGNLTALVLENDERRLIRALETDGTITTESLAFG